MILCLDLDKAGKASKYDTQCARWLRVNMCSRWWTIDAKIDSDTHSGGEKEGKRANSKRELCLPSTGRAPCIHTASDNNPLQYVCNGQFKRCPDAGPRELLHDHVSEQQQLYIPVINTNTTTTRWVSLENYVRRPKIRRRALVTSALVLRCEHTVILSRRHATLSRHVSYYTITTTPTAWYYMVITRHYMLITPYSMPTA